MENVIELNNVSMQYRMNAERINSLKEFIIKAAKGELNYQSFEALKGITFDVKKGETVGIVGHNGAGKSTLLKIISGILKPTTGTISVNGNVVPMLELGSGFDFELTGRENIFLNGAILGYSEEFLNAKYDEIVEFSELGQFIHQPIRNYSSGMLARLAFSIASVVEPEILIVDEILSVGDAGFQEKSHNRMLELMSGGTTVLFVSHNLEQIRSMCNKVVWIEHGEIRKIGECGEVCDVYEQA